MGISQIGVSSTTVDTTKPPKFTYANRYSWSTFGGSGTQGALLYRSADNSLYKMDNTNSASGTFQKWSLTSNSATNLTALYNTSNPISWPVLVNGSDGNIYICHHTDNTTTYSVGVNKYDVAANTWASFNSGSTTYSTNLVNAPEKRSYFTNANDVVFMGGNLGSGSVTLTLFNQNAGTNYAVNYNIMATPTPASYSQNRFIEIKNGSDVLYPTGYLLIQSPNTAQGQIWHVKAGWGSSQNPRVSNALVLDVKNAPGWGFNSTYQVARYAGSSAGTQNLGTCIESRWFITTPYGTGSDLFDIKDGSITPARGLESGPNNGGTNLVYVSATKKLYFHATDNYLYEYNVTFE